MSLWPILSASLIAGNYLRSTSDETKSILMNEKVIAIDQNPAARPVQTLSSYGKIRAPWRHMANRSIIVSIFNRGSDPVLTGFKWSMLSGKLAGKEMECSRPVEARDRPCRR
jgi:alpha-galactosidase